MTKPLLPANFQWVDLGQSSSLQLNSGIYQDLAGVERASALLKDWAGINLPNNDKNRSLMAGRLAPILRAMGIETLSEYIDVLEKNPSKELVSQFICAMTTNTTEFFREPKHYDILKKLLGEAIQKGIKKLRPEIRIWCAAASTGQEPYSLLITLLETLPNPYSWDIQFLATDIDVKVLNRASQGVYTKQEVQNVPPHILANYFKRKPGDDSSQSSEDKYVVRGTIRNMIRFAPFNLLTAPFPFQHPFDFIFCRNVLIYFDRETASGVIQRSAQALRRDGYLFIGHAETVVGKSPLLRSVAHAVYQRKT
jgi:chemotaxis protein methyltransferase CheR